MFKLENGEIARVKRKDGRYVYYIDVGGVPPKNIVKYMNDVKKLSELYNELKDDAISPHTIELEEGEDIEY